MKYHTSILAPTMQILTAVNFLVVSNLHEEEVDSASSVTVGGGGYVAVVVVGAGAVLLLFVPPNIEIASSPLIRSADSKRPFNSLNDASDSCWLIIGVLLGLPSPGGRGRLLRPKTIFGQIELV